MDITQLSGVSSDYLNTFAKKEALVPGDDGQFQRGAFNSDEISR